MFAAYLSVRFVGRLGTAAWELPLGLEPWTTVLLVSLIGIARVRLAPDVEDRVGREPRHVARGTRHLMLLLLLRLIDVRRLTEEHLGGFHHRLRQRRVRVDGELQVGSRGAHLDRQHAFRDQFAGA